MSGRIPTTPWHARALACLPAQGDYADYVGWREWIIEEEGAEFLEDLDEVSLVHLYAICCTLWDQTH